MKRLFTGTAILMKLDDHFGKIRILNLFVEKGFTMMLHPPMAA
jgi:hypothetical protein